MCFTLLMIITIKSGAKFEEIERARDRKSLGSPDLNNFEGPHYHIINQNSNETKHKPDKSELIKHYRSFDRRKSKVIGFVILSNNF